VSRFTNEISCRSQPNRAEYEFRSSVTYKSNCKKHKKEMLKWEGKIARAENGGLKDAPQKQGQLGPKSKKGMSPLGRLLRQHTESNSLV
jgi:hypothetical protein